MKDRSQEKTPTKREPGQSGSRVRFSLSENKARSTQQAVPEKISPAAAIDELIKHFPLLVLFGAVNSVGTMSRTAPIESNRRSQDRRNSQTPIDLSSFTSEPATSPNKTDNKVLPAITIDTINTGDLAALETYVTNGGDVSVISVNGHPLIIHVLMVATASLDHQQCSLLKNKQTNQFNLLLRHTLLLGSDTHNEFMNNYLEKNSVIDFALLDTARRNLYIEALTLWRRLTTEIDRQSEELENYLVQSGLEGVLPNYNFKDLQSLSLYIKMICSAAISADNFNQFHWRHISKLTQALLSIAKPEEITSNISLLWKDFDLKQRFIAVIIVKELLIADMYQSPADHTPFIVEINVFIRDQLSVMPVHGDTLRRYLEAIIATGRRFKQNYCLHNYLTLERWLCKPKITSSLEIIDDLLKKSLQNTEEQQRVAEIIASELSALMIIIYKHLKASEFNVISSGNVLGNKGARNLSAIIALVNNISLFVEHTIVSADTAINASHYIGLFIVIAHKLCLPRGECGPDLCTAAAIIMGLTAGPVARLNHCFNMLPEQIFAVFKALEKLFDQSNNAKWLRLMMIAHPNAIPFSGCLQKDLTFINDANGDFKNSASMIGALYDDLNQRLRKIVMVPCVLKTDLAHCLSLKAALTDQDLENLSYKHVPPKWLIINLSFEEIHAQLKSYLDSGVVPIIVSKDDVKYSVNEAYKPLCDYLSVCLYHDPVQSNNTNIHRARLLIHRLFDVIQRNNPQLRLQYTSIEYLKKLPLLKIPDAPVTTDNAREANNSARNSLH